MSLNQLVITLVSLGLLSLAGFPFYVSLLLLGFFYIFVFRKNLFEVFFPKVFYRRYFLSIDGLKDNPELERKFRKNLVKVFSFAYPEKMPTACCCVEAKGTVYTATLILSSEDGQTQYFAKGHNSEEVLREILLQLSGSKRCAREKNLSCPMDSMCSKCSIRKAHQQVNQSLAYLNPLHQKPKWKHLMERLRSS